MITIIDAIIIVLLLLGAIIGFKAGVIKSAVSFIGTIIIIFLSFKLKNPLSELMYNHLPFFNFEGALQGVTVFNIILYEGLAFLIVFAVLEVLLKILIFASGILETILRLTIVFGMFSKILGLIFGFIEYYCVIFVALLILSSFSGTNTYVKQSSLATNILNNTPILTNYFKDTKSAIEEIVSLQETYSNDKNEYNKQALEIMIKYNVISKEQVEKLINKNKISIEGIEDVLNKYKGGK